jgi:two-component system response regulator AtoC
MLTVLERYQWNRKKAAKALNISYRALLYKIKECGLQTADDTEGFDELET